MKKTLKCFILFIFFIGYAIAKKHNAVKTVIMLTLIFAGIYVYSALIPTEAATVTATTYATTYATTSATTVTTNVTSTVTTIVTTKATTTKVTTTCATKTTSIPTVSSTTTTTTADGYSDYEKELLTLLVFCEAGIEPYEGKVAVAAVVLNRVDDETSLFENSIYGVIFQKYQFSSTSNGRFYNQNSVVELSDIETSKLADCKAAVEDAIQGWDPSMKSLYFYNPQYCSQEELMKRRNIKNTITIGDHIFYREW